MNQQPVRNRTLSVAQWRELTLEGLYIPVRIQLNGHSMRPLVRKQRDFVTIHPLKRPLQRGDVVLFADNIGRYVVHRVWKLEPSHVITMGDHCEAPDLPLEYDQIWGLVTKLERGRLEISLDCPAARFYGALWMGILPLRRRYYHIRAFAGRIYHKLKGR